MDELFPTDWGVDQSPVDTTEITTTLLYYSKEESLEFKQLCKAAMRKEFPETFQNENISNLLLKILRAHGNA